MLIANHCQYRVKVRMASFPFCSIPFRDPAINYHGRSLAGTTVFGSHRLHLHRHASRRVRYRQLTARALMLLYRPRITFWDRQGAGQFRQLAAYCARCSPAGSCSNSSR